ncbi:MAG: hypothetical protein RQ824_04655 [bacterium]|nr:hypothetical protein [bacterium]
MIRFLLKMIIVFIVALAAVIYHNTDAGRDMERRIGEEMSLGRLAERGEDLFDSTIYFLSLKGLEYKAQSEEALKKSLKDKSFGKKNNSVTIANEESSARPKVEKKEELKNIKKSVIEPDNKEQIGEEDRKRLLQIIEGG